MNGSKEIDAECSSGPNPKQMHVCIHSEEGGRDEIPDMFAEQLGLAGRADFFFFFLSFAFSELLNNYNSK